MCVLLTFAIACSDDDGGDEEDSAETTTTAASDDAMPTCDELFGEGVTLREDAFDIACTTEDDPEGTFYGATTVDCADGRTLAYMELGWGYVGAEWHTDATEPPASELEACNP